MDEEKILILVNGEDKTNQVEKIYTNQYGKIEIKYYKKEKIYSYYKNNIIVRDKAEEIELAERDIYYKHQILFDVKKLIRFQEFIKIIYGNRETEVFRYNDISFKSNSEKNLNKDVIGYFRKIAKNLKDKNGEKENSFLKTEYQNINYINSESVLNYYINKMDLKVNNEEIHNLIYPFRFNLSQKEAIENVYKSNISVIQGPPGTGKTQTILNIIANLAIMQNKTVAIVSNNNEAVKNVKDKLEKNGYGFFVADLGRNEKRENFFKDVPQPYVEGFSTEDKEEELLKQIEALNKKIDELLQKNNQKAKLEKEISEYELEQKYFEEYYAKQNIGKITKLPLYNKTDDRILEFILDNQLLKEGRIRAEWFHKLKMLLKYGIKDLNKLDDNFIDIMISLQREFYKIKIERLKKEYARIESILSLHNFTKLQDKHQQISERILRKRLYEKYNGKSNQFSLLNYKNNIDKFLNAFPVVLSTTYSLRRCIPRNFMFDYVIMDESSQIDLLAGSIALSCAKNVVIVGDEKQLPQIVDKNIKSKVSNECIDICYDYFENSMLSAIVRTFGEKLPQKILKEHYRCHPKIIEFCNKRYYNDKLIAFSSKEHPKVKKPLILYYTTEGNHMRKITKGDNKGTFNDREREVIINEVLENNNINSYKDDEIGVMTPYRMQADNLQKDTNADIESDTIHKFQGREKKLMILSTVIDSSRMGRRGIEFVDDPCMVNVAVSRAIEQFAIVTDKKLFNKEGKDIKALLRYIKYNELDAEIVESQIISVFDLLYKEYSKKLEKLNRSLLSRSRFKSENIVDTILSSIFQDNEFLDYKYGREILIRNLIRNIEDLTEAEKKYINNGARVDFVIYDKMNNMPALLIEVDGFEYHKNKPSQLEKDKLKDNIARKKGFELVRLETAGISYDEEKIKHIIKEKLIGDE